MWKQVCKEVRNHIPSQEMKNKMVRHTAALAISALLLMEMKEFEFDDKEMISFTDMQFWKWPFSGSKLQWCALSSGRIGLVHILHEG